MRLNDKVVEKKQMCFIFAQNCKEFYFEQNFFHCVYLVPQGCLKFFSCGPSRKKIFTSYFVNTFLMIWHECIMVCFLLLHQVLTEVHSLKPCFCWLCCSDIILTWFQLFELLLGLMVYQQLKELLLDCVVTDFSSSSDFKTITLFSFSLHGAALVSVAADLFL